MSQQAQEVFAAEAGISQSPDGFMTGVEPAARVGSTAPVPQAQPAPQGRTFTEEDLAKARREEKDKLYDRLESMQRQLAQLEKEREDREAEEQRAIREAEEEARKKAESEMDVRKLLEQRQQEFQQQLEQERQAREQAFALLEQERRFQELNEYRLNRLADEQDHIIPELADLVTGNSKEEIEASLASIKERSARILDNAQAAMQNARRDMAGPRVTSPAIGGPLDINTEQESLSPEAIRNMSFKDYVAMRPKLLGKSRSDQGLFG